MPTLLLGESQPPIVYPITLDIRRVSRDGGQEYQLWLIWGSPHVGKLLRYLETCKDIGYKNRLRSALSTGVHRDNTDGPLIWRHDTENTTVYNSYPVWWQLYNTVTRILHSLDLVESLIKQTFGGECRIPPSLWLMEEEKRVTRVVNCWYVALQLLLVLHMRGKGPIAPLKKLAKILSFFPTEAELVQASNKVKYLKKNMATLPTIQECSSNTPRLSG